jgi:hypothetical protein
MSGFFALAAVFNYFLIGWADRHTGGLRGTLNTETAARTAANPHTEG